jgi:hypothetical protein
MHHQTLNKKKMRGELGKISRQEPRHMPADLRSVPKPHILPHFSFVTLVIKGQLLTFYEEEIRELRHTQFSRLVK